MQEPLFPLSPTSSQVIYTDGACSPNPGKGAWAVVLEDKVLCTGVEENTTNNRMELTAGLEALRYAHTLEGVVEIISDSNYLVMGYNSWMHKWYNQKGRAKKNDDLWAAIYELYDPRFIFTWVRGHDGNAGNELADSTAQALLDTP